MDIRELKYVVPLSVRRSPTDLKVVVAAVALTNVSVALPVINQSFLRILFALPFIIFLPGYSFIAALFPEKYSDSVEEGEDAGGLRGGRGLTWVERFALSMGLSLVIVPFVGMVLNYTPFGIRLVPVLLSVSVVTVAFSVVAAFRRSNLPEEEQYAVPFREWWTKFKRDFVAADTKNEKIVNIALALSVLFLLASLTYSLGTPKQNFTEFYLLTEDNETRDLVAANYDTNLSVGEKSSVYVGITNHEHRKMEYTVVTQLQRVETVGNNTTRVVDRESLGEYGVELRDNETSIEKKTYTAGMTGERLRLAFMLYRNKAPPNPTIRNSYEDLHLWINVTEP